MFLIAFGIFGYSGFQTQPYVVVIKVLSKDLRLSSQKEHRKEASLRGVSNFQTNSSNSTEITNP